MCEYFALKSSLLIDYNNYHIKYAATWTVALTEK